MRVVSAVLALAMSLTIIGGVLADEGKKGPEGKHPQGPMWGPMDMFKDLNLTDEQKAKVEALKTEYGPKFKEQWTKMGDLHKEMKGKVDAILTPEQKEQLKKSFEGKWGHPPMGMPKPDGKHGRHASCGTKPDGKHGHDPFAWEKEAIEKVNLTDDQKAKVMELAKEYAPKVKDAEEKREQHSNRRPEEGSRRGREGRQGRRQARAEMCGRMPWPR